MSSDSEDNLTPPDILQIAAKVTNSLLPDKFRKRYDKCYEDFISWKTIEFSGMAGKVWSTFSAKKSDGHVVKLRIQDMPAERLDDVINLLTDYYNNNDVFNKLVGIYKNPEAAAEAAENMRQWYKASPSSVVICCEDNGSDVGNIVGAAVTGIMTTKDNPEEFLNAKYKTKEVEKLYGLYAEMLKFYDVFKENKVDRYSDERGLAVNADYGFEVLKELLNVTRKLCKELKVPLVSSFATSDVVQKAAEADGWETAFEITREETGKRLGVTITEGPASYKIMIGKAF